MHFNFSICTSSFSFYKLRNSRSLLYFLFSQVFFNIYYFKIQIQLFVNTRKPECDILHMF